MKRSSKYILSWPTMLLAGTSTTMISMAYVRDAVADQLLVLSVLEAVVLGILVHLIGISRKCPSHGATSMSANTTDAFNETPSDGLPKTISANVAKILAHGDVAFQELAQLRLASISSEIQLMASGQLVFIGSESWRTAYERILRTPGLRRYLSVAWLRTEDYWRDAPGRRSIQFNYDLVELGLAIERIVILNDFFWAPAALLPAKPVLAWLQDQHKHKINLRLVRESEIEDETGLLGDFGIYGDRAVGNLDMDDQCRSLRFTLDFSRQSVQLAEERWRRLELFAVSFREVLDRGAQGR